ncbi:hypothetical protein ABU614_14725 [Lysobacter firmicutimachus]|uniref:DUF4328 domain-containing protein n=1 Tax=Lysobacter firmicutimachus TaxID=1792846 RepID=A0AAU8MMB5_9GAMM
MKPTVYTTGTHHGAGLHAWLKFAATLAVAALLTHPWWAPQWGAGLLGEVRALGPAGAIAAMLAFFALVACYCRHLQAVLQAIPASARRAPPGSVWWMFAIPYNFVEDFFIVAAIAGSLRADGRIATAQQRRWQRLGLGWCAPQIASLWPGTAGVLAGAAALALWAAHWRATLHILRGLRDTAPSTPTAAADVATPAR